MQMQTSCHTRKAPAHPPPKERHNTPVVVHVTVCARERRSVFDSPAAHAALRQAWELAEQWRVAEYVIMPDHIHLFCVPGVFAPEPLKRWTAFWKRIAGQNDATLRGVWQRDIWDTQMRDFDHFTEKCSYMRMNPVRRGLVATPEAWPYAGKLRDVVW